MIPHVKYSPHRRGTRFIDTIELLDEDDQARDLTGLAFSCKGREYTGATTELCTFAVVVIGDPLDGVISVELDSASTLDPALDDIATIAASLISIDAAGEPTEELTFDLPLLARITT